MNVFLDTMVYLHCTPIDQINFEEILGGAVTILVPRVTFKELDKHKSTNSSSRTRERARQSLKFLESKIISGDPVRDNVLIQFLPNMPQIDLSQHGLNPAWNDDLLIASILEVISQDASVESVLVTLDTGARLTCMHLGIRTLELPDKYRLQPELDESEKENQRLRRELQKLQNALPKISIGFAGGEDATAKFALKRPVAVDESQISASLNEVIAQYPELPEKQVRKKSVEGSSTEAGITRKLSYSDLSLNAISDKEIRRYNEERTVFLERYEQYLRDQIVKRNMVKRSIRFTIAISNSGTSPADDVDVHLHFPDGFSLYVEENLPTFRGKPEPPHRPRSDLEVLKSVAKVPDLFMPHRSLLNVNPPSSFRLKKTNSYDISDHFARIKHGTTENLPELTLVFDSFDEASSFNCDYTIRVGNLPEPIAGKLHFVIDKSS